MSRLHITNTLSRLHMWYWVIYSCDMELKITNSSPLKITNFVGLLHININKREHITNSMSHLHMWCDETLSHLKITSSNHRKITNSMSHLHINKSCAYQNSMTWLIDIWKTRWVRDQFVLSSWSYHNSISRLKFTDSMSHLNMWYGVISKSRVRDTCTRTQPHTHTHIHESSKHVIWSHFKITSSNHTKITNSMSHLHINKSCAYHNSMTWLTDIWMTRW